jgi:hypothetical protein
MRDLALNETRLAKFHKINVQIEEACDKAQITWNHWEALKEKANDYINNCQQENNNPAFEIYERDKRRKEKISYQDNNTGKALFGTVKKVITIMTNRWRSNHALQMYKKPSTKNLYLIRKGDSGCSNNYFNNCKSNISDGLTRFIIKSRTGDIWNTFKIHRYLGQGDGICSCGKIGYFNHLMNNCLHQGTRMTKRHDAIVDID